MLELAFTHRSYAYEAGLTATNERLEFLGDSVLGLIVTEELYLKYPDLDESRLSPLRSGIVNMRALADIARTLELGKYIRLGKGEEVTNGRDKNSLLADALEALIGAIYLQCGELVPNTGNCLLNTKFQQRYRLQELVSDWQIMFELIKIFSLQVIGVNRLHKMERLNLEEELLKL